jgi:rhamnose transport system permease protein
MRMRRYKREISVAVAYVALLTSLAIVAPSFFQSQFFATLVSSSAILVAAVGMTLVILARHIDISIGSQFSVCGVVAGLAASAGWPMPAVAAIAMGAGAAMGAVNGVLVAFAGLPSIVVALATMVILREGLRYAREGEAVRNLPADFQWFGLSQEAGQWVVVGIALIAFAVFAWGMRYLGAGRAVYAVGSDAEAARLAGIRTPRVVFGVFVLMGLLTGLASLLGSVRFAIVDANAGAGLELQVIAAVVVGGTAVSGGRGTLLGTLFGVLLLGTIGAALVFLQAQSQWEKAIQGLIILVAVAVDGISEQRRRC